MSKFCGVCGAEMRDDAVVCSNCGTQLRSSVENFGQGAKTTKKGIASITDKFNSILKSNDPKSKKLFAIVGAGAAGLIVLIIVIIAVASSFGPKGLAKKYFKAVKKDDASIIAKVTNEEIAEYYKDQNDEDIEDAYDDSIDSIRDNFKDEVGAKYSLSYEIINVRNLDEDDIEDMNDDFEDEDLNVNVVKAKEITFYIKAKASKDSDVTVRTIYAIKEKGKLNWTLLNSYYY